MVTSWVTVKPVIARIVRNMRGIDADTIVDLPEWIAEAIGKLKTHYQLVLECKEVPIEYHMAKMPCNEDGLAAVTCGGQRLLPSSQVGPIGGSGSDRSPSSTYVSVLRMPVSIKDIDETDINNYPFYLSTVDRLDVMPINTTQFYRTRYNKIETSIESGILKLYIWTTPKDEDGLPMVPKHEDYHTAIYWYCRMMAIGAGYIDPVFSYDKCEQQWNIYASRAIADIAYPSIDEKKANIISNVSLIPNQYEWETFDGGGAEGPFID